MGGDYHVLKESLLVCLLKCESMPSNTFQSAHRLRRNTWLDFRIRIAILFARESNFAFFASRVAVGFWPCDRPATWPPSAKVLQPVKLRLYARSLNRCGPFAEQSHDESAPRSPRGFSCAVGPFAGTVFTENNPAVSPSWASALPVAGFSRPEHFRPPIHFCREPLHVEPSVQSASCQRLSLHQ